eukprot:tig00001335_g8214.t1
MVPAFKEHIALLDLPRPFAQPPSTPASPHNGPPARVFRLRPAHHLHAHAHGESSAMRGKNPNDRPPRAAPLKSSPTKAAGRNCSLGLQAKPARRPAAPRPAVLADVRLRLEPAAEFEHPVAEQPQANAPRGGGGGARAGGGGGVGAGARAGYVRHDDPELLAFLAPRRAQADRHTLDRAPAAPPPPPAPPAPPAGGGSGQLPPLPFAPVDPRDPALVAALAKRRRIVDAAAAAAA